MSFTSRPSQAVSHTMDDEHRVQVGLINALCRAVEENQPTGEVGLILERLVDYSEAHFSSEELLMRLDSYDGYEQHVEDHERMIDALQQMQRSHKEGASSLIPSQAQSSLAFLLNHIETKDRRYANWIRD